MSRLAVKTDNLGKKYHLDPARKAINRNLREDLMRFMKKPFSRRGREEAFWALRHLNLEVEAGQALGLVGSNGSGKSTLLKMLSRVVWPSEGSIEIYGSIGSLLEVGTGFHPELTGRENVFLSGSILGMKRREILYHFDEIVEFSGVAPFLETPVKRYSSGMFMRLAFSVMAHLRSEILIIDEVLAVGDLAFQQQCFAKMHEILEDGRTIIFVSHQMETVRTLCDHVVWLEEGKFIEEGPVHTVLEKYQAYQERPLPAHFKE
ncbi:MAG: Teichoic acids export ATP-binding protein TagH [Chlamydiae bacterium]|nr:Teichoic acids export ATP-binding protein TagH [Chlamydiota bacterium]